MTREARNPVLLEILSAALVAAAEEMSITVQRTSRSTTVRELLDFSTAVLDADGRNLAQAARMPVHLNSMELCLREVVTRHLPLDGWRDGDVVVTNDPYAGGQHLPDFLAYKPVFVDGRRIAIACALIHHVDVGGGSAGGYNPAAVEIFQEGFRLPPVRLVREGAMQDDLLATVLANVREPETFRGDILSQVAALEIGARAVRALAARYGGGLVADVGREIMDRSEAAMRAAIAALPDGTYCGEDFIDGDGIEPGRKRIAVTLTIAGDRMAFDFSGTSPQARGPVNATMATLKSAVYYAAVAATGVEGAVNAGCYRPLEVSAPGGTLVNAAFPAPVAMRMLTGHRIVTAVLRAFAEAAPGRIPASYYAVTFNYAAGIIHADGRRQVYFDSEIGGWGAHPRGDGASALAAGFHNSQNAPVEMIEAIYPLTFTRYGLRHGSGGAGLHRGGDGLVREWRFDAPEGRLNTAFDAFQSAPYGLAGGEDGRGGRLAVVRGDETIELPSKVDAFPLEAGDLVRIETPGGGGWGRPVEEPRGASTVSAEAAP